jgi:uncharacterized membrane protein
MRLFGHPVHPLVVAFPIALLALTPLWDGVAFVGIEPRLSFVAYWSSLAGLVAGGIALVTGVLDFVALKDPTPELTKTAFRHAGYALSTLSVFVLAFVFRGGPSGEPGALVLGLEALGALGLGVTGWLGGHLVFGHGAGMKSVR